MGSKGMVEEKTPLLRVQALKKYFPIVKGFFNRVVGQIRAVDEVSFSLHEGECLALVGESGSGKTTVGRSILRAIQPTGGSVWIKIDDVDVDISKASEAELKVLRRHMQLIFQDPYSSLNPRMTVLDIVGEPLLVNKVYKRRAREEHVAKLLKQVGLDPHHMRRYPHAFSGGQRQRIGIARALALQPRLIVADEPVSALDVSVQAQVLNLLQELQTQYKLTYLFISHDLGVVRHIADRVAVMYAGRLVEIAPVDHLFDHPRHPYTEALISAMPIPDPKRAIPPVLLPGEVADPSNLPGGCAFHPRCRYAEDRCRQEMPDMREVEAGHMVRCHLAEALSLDGLMERG
jgi:peptide/nickel transport system ATP-binding protein